ncbi:MAG: MgtC/SapB family protein [Gemmatimonadales bacterium]
MSLVAAMQDSVTDLEGAGRLAIAASIGLAVGLEREWSGHASGPQGRFAGLRTFLLFGLLGGVAGLLLARADPAAGAITLAGGALFAVAAYVMAARRQGADLDGTTEAAALVVLALGALSGLGQGTLSAGVAALVVFALGEKERLHAIVRHIGDREMHAALEFAVLALVILPLLPEGPFGPVGGVSPRSLWGVVLFISGVQFVGYVARHAIGARRGYGLTGMLAGIASSTTVTLQFARQSRQEPRHSAALAFGALAACAVMPVRVTIISLVLSSATAVALAPYVVPMVMVGLATVVLGLRDSPDTATPGSEAEPASPMRIWSAIQMAAVFQAAMMAVTLTQQRWGSTGVATSAAGLGLVDVDALTISLTHMASGQGAAALAAKAIAIGIASNTLLKLLVGVVLGSGAFRRAIAIGLGAMLFASAAGFWWASLL